MVFLLKASIVIVILLAFYKLFLERESFFAVNRFYLLASLLLAFSLPFIALPKLATHQGIVSTWLEEATFQKQSRPIYEPIESEIKEIKPSNSVNPKENNFVANSLTKTDNFGYWLFLIYVFGVIVLTAHLFFQLVSVFLVIHRTDYQVEDKDCTIFNVRDDSGPRSFFKYVFINPKKYNTKTYEQILEHEKIHVKQRHSIDLLLSEIAIIALWFNPFVWLFRKEIEKNIEYQTDDLVLESSAVEPQTYQMSLLEIGVERKPLTIVSNYNQSLIKKRIVMMNKKKSNAHNYWKYAFIAPTLLVTLLMLNQPFSVKAQEINTNESMVMRNIEIAGLVLDAESLLPIEGAIIYDKNFGVLSQTDKDGYFKANLDYAKTKEGIYFGFKVGKDDYITFNQDENWGIQPSKIGAIYYIGISKKTAKSSSFSKLFLNSSDSSINSVLANFESIKENIKNQIEFNKKAEIAKRGNEEVFISIDENYYIVSNSGWIKLNSKNDLVSIDGRRSIPAFKLNSVVKRKIIKGMTPLSSENIPFEIYTE
jgi:BlaR1 peptidase M56